MRGRLSPAALSLLFTLVACGTSVVSRPVTAADFVCPDAGTPTLTAQVQAKVFTPHCAVACHQGLNSQGYPLTLVTAGATQATAVGRTSRYAGSGGTLRIVDPGSLDNSTLWLKVLGGSPTLHGPGGESVGQQMPLGGSLDEASLDTVKAWICTGARADAGS